MARRLTGRENFLRRIEGFALSALPIKELTAAAPEHYDGVMVALVPEDPGSLAVDGDGALPAEDLHVTLCYLGKVQDLSSFDKTKILADTRRVCDEIGHAFSTTVDGVVVMGSNDDGVPATALLVQSEDIVELYEAVSEALNFESKFPSFIPHMTAGYGVPAEVAGEKIGQQVAFNSVVVKFGDDRHIIPLAAAIVAAPRTANVIDRVIDSLGRLWDEALHPRDSEGRFIKKNGAVSGKLAVPTRDRKGVTMVDANRASVVGFHTFGEDVWVLAEITNPDGSTTQGFARATSVRSVAPVKARLDALYPIDDTGDAFINSSLERKRQLDLILAHINTEYGSSNDEYGAREFLDSLGLWEKDLDYLQGGDDASYLGGLRKVERQLDDDEVDEQEDIINDARTVKELRDRVHGLKEGADLGVSAEDAHVVPKQRLLQGDAPEPEVVDALKEGADPLALSTNNLLGAMDESGRFNRISPEGDTGVSPIEWYVDPADPTGVSVKLAGVKQATSDRAYFVKQSVIGAELGNTDIVNEVTVSLIAENVAESAGDDDSHLLKIPRSVFGDNPEWDGTNPPGSGDPFAMEKTHQPGHVVSQHVGYLIPSDWNTTDIASEETSFRNDIRDLDEASQRDQTLAFYEDIGDVYGHEVAKMILLDFVILNGDRNPGNAILAASPDGTQSAVLPIDHGFAFDEPFAEGDSERTFEWFMNYQFTQAWRNYVQGGLRLDNNVTESSLRQTVEGFLDAHSNLSVEAILSKFRTMPGVSDQQVEQVEESLKGSVDRLNWMRNNIDAVLRALTGESDVLM